MKHIEHHPAITNYKNTLIIIGFFTLAIFPFIVFQLNFFTKMPGDIGDSRLNNYYLENIYQFLQGKSSLINLNFYYPFPDMLGLGENLFGASFIYIFSRMLSFTAESSFQIWIIFSFLFNYLACYFSLRLLKISLSGAIFGALIFAFGLPVSGHLVHAQLCYRFGIPLAITFFILFFNDKNWKYLIISSFFFVWQFYCSIYLGLFLILMLLVTSFGFFFHSYCLKKKRFFEPLSIVFKDFTACSKKFKIICVFFLLSALISLIVLMYPYSKAQSLYGVQRSIFAISSMLPKIQSYFVSDVSLLWASKNALFDFVNRHEHQMFIGLIPMIFSLIGLFFGIIKKSNKFIFIFSFVFIFLFAITLSLFGGWVSLWYLFIKLPLFSSIRAFTRIILVLLFPIAYLSAFSFDKFFFKFNSKKIIFQSIFFILLISEFSAVKLNFSEKNEWQTRLNTAYASIPETLPENPILFFAQKQSPFYVEEIDAMWIALNTQKPTLNGYAGANLPYFNLEFGKECSEIPARIIAYLIFINEKNNIPLYLYLIHRVVPIGFDNCNPNWWISIPNYQTHNANLNCSETIEKILTGLHISYDSPAAEKYIQFIKALDKYGIEKCIPKMKLTITN